MGEGAGDICAERLTDPGHPGAKRDPAFIERVRPVLDLYVKWYRPDVRGFEHLPPTGPFLLVGNHSGGATPPDMPLLFTAWWRERGVEEPVYGLFHSAFLNLPGVRSNMEKAGALDASNENAEAILRAGGIVIVYPGGDHEAFRPWAERNRIDFAGRKGFIRLALRTGVPIVPVVTHGVQDSIMVLTRGERLARFMPHLRLTRIKVQPILLGLPWGISPGLPTIPLPSKATVQICEPIELGGVDPDDDPAVDALYERITGTMQSVLDELAAR